MLFMLIFIHRVLGLGITRPLLGVYSVSMATQTLERLLLSSLMALCGATLQVIPRPHYLLAVTVRSGSRHVIFT